MTNQESMALLLVGLATITNALIVPTRLFSSNMVLQQSPEDSVVIWGSATPGEDVTLTDSSPFHPQSHYSATADSYGSWIIRMKPYMPSASDPNNFTLVLQGSSSPNKVTASNAAYGDVLLCSGQSNMRLSLVPIYDNVSIIEHADRPEIRLMYIPDAASMEPQKIMPHAPTDCTGTANCSIWLPSTSQRIPQFSAICYLTALSLQKLSGTKGVYGLIDSAVGSTDVQSWMSTEARQAALDTCWTPKGAPALPPSSSHAPVGGTNATELWNGMINPLVPYTLKAILWDQGENNVHYCDRSQYNCLFSSMIRDWRSRWNMSKPIPVAFVQLGGYAGLPAPIDDTGVKPLPAIRFSQSDTLPTASQLVFTNGSRQMGVPATCMTSTYDLGSPEPGLPNGTWWIHCRNKSEVGRRLALQLWNLVDGQPSAPEYTGAVVRSTELKLNPQNVPYVEITFDHASELTLSAAQGCVQCCNQSAMRTPLSGHIFEVNFGGKWFPAVGSVAMQISSDTATVAVKPVNSMPARLLAGVRYAVQDIPQCVLYNAMGLPAGPFQFTVPWNRNV